MLKMKNNKLKKTDIQVLLRRSTRERQPLIKYTIIDYVMLTNDEDREN